MASYNYKKLKHMNKAMEVDSVPEIGTWLSISSCAKMYGWSAQMLRYLFFRGVLPGIKICGGSILINADQVKKLKKQTWKTKKHS